jgi:EAL and modified HD-GYP domain-containing signal transduction protein
MPELSNLAVGSDSRQSVTIARQPILDRKGQVVAHELLYRHTADATSCTDRGDSVAARSLNDAVLSVGLDALTCGLPAFINLTHHLLLSGAGTLLPKDIAVLELREDIPVDDEVVQACRKLHADGYALALDDFVAGSPAEALVPWARYVKIDVLATSEPEWRALAKRFNAKKIKLVAEKVETIEVADATKEAGYDYFQGYFFCKPRTFATTHLPARRLAYVQLLAALNKPNLSFDELEHLVKHDLSLSYRVMRSANSAAFAVHREITSIRTALVLLGFEQIRKWASVWAMAGLSGGEAPGAVSMALVRARGCERVGELLGGSDTSGLFLMGLCSLLDVILRQSMEVALHEVPLPTPVRDALLGAKNHARTALDGIVAYERGEWDEAGKLVEQLGVGESALPEIYADSVRWARQLSQFSAQ